MKRLLSTHSLQTRLLPACLLLALASPLVASAQHPAQPSQHSQPDAALQAAINGDWRSAESVARDGYRHPAQTLAFFALKPEQTVIEITPGGGWYAEILAPYLRDGGQYIAAVVDPTTVAEGPRRAFQQRAQDTLSAKFAASTTQYDKAKVVAYDPAKPAFGAPASADLVLTFRNVHNWIGAGQAEGMFKGFFDVLKSGGSLGVVEHRADSAVSKDDKSGYLGQDQVIAMATAVGFKLQESSEINANPRDSKDHPNGVWTLPPSNRHDAADSAKYQAIGESDRMTLRFVKP